MRARRGSQSYCLVALEFRDWDVGVIVWGYGVWGFGVSGFGFMIWGLGFGVQNLASRV